MRRAGATIIFLLIIFLSGCTPNGQILGALNYSQPANDMNFRNHSIYGAGDVNATRLFQNGTQVVSGSGDITSVQAGDAYLYNGSDSGSVSLRWNETKGNETILSIASQFNETVKIDAVNLTATTANSIANTANSTASSALVLAGTANTTANSALSGAITANSTANTANSTATTALAAVIIANSTANTANTTANTALSLATTANTTANNAIKNDTNANLSSLWINGNINVGSYFFVNGSGNGFIGVGTTSPTGRLHTRETTYSLLPVYERYVASTTGPYATFLIRAESTTGTPEDTFGPFINMQTKSNTGTTYNLASFGAEMDSATNRGALVFNTYDTSETEAMRITHVGNLTMTRGGNISTTGWIWGNINASNIQNEDWINDSTASKYNDTQAIDNSTILRSYTSAGGDASGTLGTLAISDDSHLHTKTTVTLAGENITSGTVADARIASTLTRDSEYDNTTVLRTYTSFVGDVTGAYSATIVGDDTHNHTTATIRPGNYSINITGYSSTSGLASTATALAADPGDCVANTWATNIAASGTLTCNAINYAGITAMTAANFNGLISDADPIWTTSTWTGGDLAGTGLAATVNDDSHTHTKSTVTISGENITAGTIAFARLPTLTNQILSNAANISAGTFGTGNYVMDTNLTAEKYLVEGNSSGQIYGNSTCSLVLKGLTSTVCII